MGRIGGNNGLDLDELHGGPVTGSGSEINGMGIQGYFLVRVSFSIGLFLCFFTRFYLTFFFATYLLVGGFCFNVPLWYISCLVPVGWALFSFCIVDFCSL